MIDGSMEETPVPVHASIQDLIEAERTLVISRGDPIDRPIRFTSRRSRDDHARMPVLAGRKERWHQILDPDLVGAVRDASDDPAAFERLAGAYESVLAAAFERAVDGAVEGGGHAVRLVQFEVLPPTGEGGMLGGFRSVSRTIIAWCPEQRLRIIAGIPVSRAGVTSYRLLSGYRHDLRASAGRFVRAVRERILDRVDRSQERLIDPLPADLPDVRADHRATESPSTQRPSDPRSLEHG